MAAPDFTGAILPFVPASKWYAGQALLDHPEQLLECVKQVPSLGDGPDDLGNMQSCVRLDHDDDGEVGLWVTVPEGTSWDAVDGAVEAFTPHAPAAEPPSDPPVPASVSVEIGVAAVMATVAITSPTLTNAQKAQIQTTVRAKIQQVLGSP